MISPSSTQKDDAQKPTAAPNPRRSPLTSSSLSEAGTKLDPQLITQFVKNLRQIIACRGGDLELRDDQIQVLETIISAVENGTRTGFEDLCPRWGKTRIMIALARAWPGKTLLVTEYRNLVGDLHKELRRFAPELSCGRIGSHARVSIASAHGAVSAARKGKLSAGEHTLILWDESHLSLTGNRITRVLDIVRPHALSFGFTGTDHFNDNKNCTLVWGACLSRVTLDQGINSGILLNPKSIFVRRSVDLKGVPFLGGDLSGRTLQARLLNHPEELAAIVQIVKRHPDEGILVACAGVDHGLSIAAHLRKKGITAECLFGKHKALEELPAAQRDNKAILRRFNAGEIQVLVGRKLIALGLDLPRASVLIKSAPTFSQVFAEQLFPRVMTCDPSNPQKAPAIYEFLYPHPRGFGVLYPSIVSGELVVRAGLAYSASSSTERNEQSDSENPYIEAAEQVLQIEAQNRLQLEAAARLPKGWIRWSELGEICQISAKKGAKLATRLCAIEAQANQDARIHPQGIHPRVAITLVKVLEANRPKAGWMTSRAWKKLCQQNGFDHEIVTKLVMGQARQEAKLAWTGSKEARIFSPDIQRALLSRAWPHRSSSLEFRIRDIVKDHPSIVNALVNAQERENADLPDDKDSSITRFLRALDATMPAAELLVRRLAKNRLTGEFPAVAIPSGARSHAEDQMIACITNGIFSGELSISDFALSGKDLLMADRLGVKNSIWQQPISATEQHAIAQQFSLPWETFLEPSPQPITLGQMQNRLLAELGISFRSLPASSSELHRDWRELRFDVNAMRYSLSTSRCAEYLHAVAHLAPAFIAWGHSPEDSHPRLRIDDNRICAALKEFQTFCGRSEEQPRLLPEYSYGPLVREDASIILALLEFGTPIAGPISEETAHELASFASTLAIAVGEKVTLNSSQYNERVHCTWSKGNLDFSLDRRSWIPCLNSIFASEHASLFRDPVCSTLNYLPLPTCPYKRNILLALTYTEWSSTEFPLAAAFFKAAHTVDFTSLQAHLPENCGALLVELIQELATAATASCFRDEESLKIVRDASRTMHKLRAPRTKEEYFQDLIVHSLGARFHPIQCYLQLRRADTYDKTYGFERSAQVTNLKLISASLLAGHYRWHNLAISKKGVIYSYKPPVTIDRFPDGQQPLDIASKLANRRDAEQFSDTWDLILPLDKLTEHSGGRYVTRHGERFSRGKLEQLVIEQIDPELARLLTRTFEDCTPIFMWPGHRSDMHRAQQYSAATNFLRAVCAANRLRQPYPDQALLKLSCTDNPCDPFPRVCIPTEALEQSRISRTYLNSIGEALLPQQVLILQQSMRLADLTRFLFLDNEHTRRVFESWGFDSLQLPLAVAATVAVITGRPFEVSSPMIHNKLTTLNFATGDKTICFFKSPRTSDANRFAPAFVIAKMDVSPRSAETAYLARPPRTIYNGASRIVWEDLVAIFNTIQPT